MKYEITQFGLRKVKITFFKKEQSPNRSTTDYVVVMTVTKRKWFSNVNDKDMKKYKEFAKRTTLNDFVANK